MATQIAIEIKMKMRQGFNQIERERIAGSTETPSARAYPFPRASKDLQAASGDSMCIRFRARHTEGLSTAWLPPTIA